MKNEMPLPPAKEVELLDADALVSFDLLNVKRTVEVRVRGNLRSVRLLADVRGEVREIAIPGGEFSLGMNEPALLLAFLKLVTGYHFDRIASTDEDDDEVWVRADHPRRRQAATQGNA